MGILNVIFGKTPFSGVKSGVGYEQLSNAAASYKDLAADLFKVEQAKRRESFTLAVERLGLTEQDLFDREHGYRRIGRTFVGIAVAILCYAAYLSWFGSIFSVIACGGLVALCSGMAFRYSFWAFQIKHRKLGCTFNEWLDGKVRE